MSAAASVCLDRTTTDHATINRANAQHSTGPRTQAGKHRSSQNALTHGLFAQSVVLAPEEEAAYQQLCTKFFEEYQPATATEASRVQLLADTTGSGRRWLRFFKIASRAIRHARDPSQQRPHLLQRRFRPPSTVLPSPLT